MGQEAGVVDQNADAVVLAQPPLDTPQVGLVGQVGLHDVHAHARLAAQAIGELLHAGDIARHQNNVMATAGETVGVNGANAGRSAGDKHGGFHAH
jgi:hypothetical protein